MATEGVSTQGDRAAERDAIDTSTVLGKTFVIFGAYGPSDDILTLAELTDRTGLPKSTVHRLADTLVGLGALERYGDGFHLGTKLFELGELARRRGALREIALPFMQDLYEATHETVHLGVLDGDEVLYIEKLSGHRRANAPSRVGGRMPLVCTGLGKAMLAFSPRSLIEHVVAEPLERRTPYTITVPEVLLQQLVTIRERGVAFDHEESKAGVSCVASPILDLQRRAVGALSITGPTPRVRLQSLAPAVQTAALALSRAMTERGRE